MAMPERPLFNPFELPRVHGRYLGIPQGAEEPDEDYRRRVIDELVRQDEFELVRIYEVATGLERNDPRQDPDSPMIGILRARHFSTPEQAGDPYRQRQVQIVHAILARAKNEAQGGDALRIVSDLFGPDKLLGLLDAVYKPQAQAS